MRLGKDYLTYCFTTKQNTTKLNNSWHYKLAAVFQSPLLGPGVLKVRNNVVLGCPLNKTDSIMVIKHSQINWISLNKHYKA